MVPNPPLPLSHFHPPPGDTLPPFQLPKELHLSRQNIREKGGGRKSPGGLSSLWNLLLKCTDVTSPPRGRLCLGPLRVHRTWDAQFGFLQQGSESPRRQSRSVKKTNYGQERLQGPVFHSCPVWGDSEHLNHTGMVANSTSGFH